VRAELVRGWKALLASPERLAFVVCGIAGLVTIWGHRYPLGIDLPQHANLFRLWADLSNGPYEYRQTYYIDYFTPYLLPYALALPLTKLFGALNATKLLFTFMVIATPWAMARWLRAIGAAPAFGLLGFVVAFDYWYIWGFMSCAVATPLMFEYLASYEGQGDAPKLSAILRTSLLAVMLFFSHGITFGVSLGVAGVIWLLRGRWFRRWRAALHVAPLGILAVVWLLARKAETGSSHIGDWANWQRAINLFSGAFMPFPDESWAKIGAAGVIVFLVLARPKLGFSVSRWVPLFLAVAGFAALPDWIASTWLVGTRFLVFIHAFAPATLVPRTGDFVARRWALTLGALVLAFLVVLNVRLRDFNRELAGFREVAAAIPPGVDVQTLVPETNNTSDVFGSSVMGQIPAWVTAEQGGLIANDSAVAGYYQIPVHRYPVPQFGSFQYAIARGNYDRLRHRLAGLTSTVRGPAKLLRQSGEWLLLQRPPIETDVFEVTRYAQGWGELRIDQTVTGGPLAVAGVTYPRGIGTHAQSFIRLHFRQPVHLVSGAFGIDDAACERGKAVFRVRDGTGKLLVESGVLEAHQPAQTFSTAVPPGDVLLEAISPGSIHCAHADWLNLTFN
jgi:hypothetical protein